MSTVNRITVFPERGTAETVLAVDLDDETTEYLSTYPGTAKRLSTQRAHGLADGLRALGIPVRTVPGLTSALRGEPERFSDLFLAHSRLWGVLAGFIVCGVIWVLPDVFGLLDGFRRLLIGGLGGFGAFGLVNMGFREWKHRGLERDEECKRIYAERLQEASDHLIWSGDPDTRIVRRAIGRANTIRGNLARLRQVGLSTADETTAVDDNLDKIISAHMEERTAKSHIERYQTILRDVDSKTVAADEDLQHVQQLNEEQSRISQEAKGNSTAAMEALNRLMDDTSQSARQAKAKLRAAKLSSEEGTR